MLRLLLAAVVLLAPLGQAAFLEDAQGDVRIGANDAPAAAPASPAYASMDLVSLDVIEEADAFTFAVQVDDLAQAEDTAPDGEICDVWMTHNGREFRIHMTRLTPAILGGRAEPGVHLRPGHGHHHPAPGASGPGGRLRRGALPRPGARNSTGTTYCAARRGRPSTHNDSRGANQGGAFAPCRASLFPARFAVSAALSLQLAKG